MYLTNTGDTLADWAAQLAKNKLKTTILGKVEVGVSDIRFVPSKREVGLQVYADTLQVEAVQGIQVQRDCPHQGRKADLAENGL